MQARGSDLEFALGYSHPVLVRAPDGITFRVEAPTRFAVEGIDKQKVGEVAANIRKLRKPDPYKGKGVRYQGEVVRRKAGSRVSSGGRSDPQEARRSVGISARARVGTFAAALPLGRRSSVRPTVRGWR